MKFYIKILNCDGGWITYAVRESEDSAKSIASMLESVHMFSPYQIRIVL